VQEMLKLASVTPDDVVMDLGSGDGRLVIAAAQIGARGIGIEYEAELVEFSRARAMEAGVADRTRFVHGDIFETDVSGASVVMLYLSPEFNIRLRPRLLEQLRPGSRVVSHAFHMGDWEPDSTVTIGSGAARATLFSWVIPADVDGFWSLEVEGRQPVVLELRQTYQRLEASASRAGQSASDPGAGRVHGTQVEFLLADPGTSVDVSKLTFSGQLNDGVLEGIATAPGGANPRRWRAVRFTDPRFRPGPTVGRPESSALT